MVIYLTTLRILTITQKIKIMKIVFITSLSTLHIFYSNIVSFKGMVSYHVVNWDRADLSTLHCTYDSQRDVSTVVSNKKLEIILFLENACNNIYIYVYTI